METRVQTRCVPLPVSLFITSIKHRFNLLIVYHIHCQIHCPLFVMVIITTSILLLVVHHLYQHYLFIMPGEVDVGHDNSLTEDDDLSHLEPLHASLIPRWMYFFYPFLTSQVLKYSHIHTFTVVNIIVITVVIVASLTTCLSVCPYVPFRRS